MRVRVESRLLYRCLVGLLALLGLVGVVAKPVFSQEDRPNIIFFLSDDHRADVMSCAGHATIQTPNLDRLAASGTRFENGFVTTSICAASRATLFTGLYERSHRFTFRTVPLSAEVTQDSYPTRLRAAGYRTGFVGKFGVAVQQDVTSEMFDYFRPLNRSPYFKSGPDGTKVHITDRCSELAIEFLEQSQDQPFCLQVSFNAPHAEDGDKEDHYPWPPSSDGKYEGLVFPRPKLDSPEVFESQPEFLKKSLNRDRYFWRWDTPEKYQKNMLAYHRLLTGVDHSIGRVLDYLDETGLSDNTVVIFCGDNGYYMAERGFAGKWSHYEESLRVPILIRDPRVKAEERGQVIDSMALNLDIAPTILSIAGVEIPAAYQGASLMWWVSGDEPDEWRGDFLIEHLMHYPGGIPKYEGVRDSRWVYARYIEQQPVYEFLHDLETDPHELKNLAADPEYREQLERMRSRCSELVDANGGVYQLDKFPLAPGAMRKPIPKREGRPNVLLLLTDDQRADTIAGLGNPVIETPNLDQLARRGFVFHNAYCLGANVGAVCRPSRNMLMSGRAYFRFDAYASAADANWPASFNAAGYQTFHMGKKGNTAREIHPVFNESHYLADQEVRRSGDPARLAVDGAIDFLERRDESRPFFMYLGFATPHDPRVAMAEDLARYRADELPLPVNYLPRHPFDNGALTIRDEKLEAWPRTEAAVRRHLRDYYGVITGIDRQIGRLMEDLERRGQLDNTIVIFSSDHGLALGSHGLFGKQSLYEHSMKSPLIVAGPGIKAGESEALVYLLDLFPTACELASLPIPDGLDGKSLVPVLKNPEQSVRETVFLAYGNVQRAVRDERWKLIAYPQINRMQLFDLSHDPDEMMDLSESEEGAAELSRLVEELRRWQAYVGDRLPLEAENPKPQEFDWSQVSRGLRQKN